jgi:RHS repeat-associated protein
MAYDFRYRVASNQLVRNGANIAFYLYGYGPAGNITAITDTVDAAYNRQFGYDDLGRLTNTSTGAMLWGTRTLIYDAMGNLKKTTLGATLSYSGSLPKLTSVVDAGRWYRSWWGRYTQADPKWNPLSIREVAAYTYVGANPLRFVDPRGLYSCTAGLIPTATCVVGPLNAARGFALSLEARRVAEATRLPGAYLGQQDAFRHCYWGCRMAQELGPSVAYTIGLVYEDCNPSAPFDRSMDLRNNDVGISLGGHSNLPGLDCASACLAALEDRRLTRRDAELVEH